MKNLNPDCVCFDKEDGWLFNNEYGLLCKFDVLTKEIKTQYKIPVELCWGSIQMSLCGNKIFLYPYWCNKLIVFYTTKEVFKEVKLIDFPVKNLFARYIGSFKDCVYIYLTNYIAIMEINVNTLECNKYVLPEKFLHKVSSNDAKCVNGSILFPVINQNMILEFEFESRKLKEHIISGFSGGVYTIAYDGAFYWITGSDKTYVKWDKETGIIVEKRYLPDTLMIYVSEKDKWREYNSLGTTLLFPFLRCIFVGHKVWLFPYMANMILQIDVYSGEFKELFCPDKNTQYIPDMKPCELLGVDDKNQGIVFATPEEGYCVLDIETLTQKKYFFYVESEFLVRQVIAETDDVTLEELIGAVCTRKNLVVKNEKQYGNKIYGYIVRDY